MRAISAMRWARSFSRPSWWGGSSGGWRGGRQAFHVGDAAFDIVGVLVVLAVVERLHELGGRVAQVERDGLGGGGFDVGEDGAVGGVDGVRFGREGEVDDGLGEGEVAFGRAEEVHGVAGGEAEVEGFGRGEADVFDGHADDAAGDVHGVFAGLQHAAEPVEGGVGVGVADGFVQRGDDVVVLLALFVVEQDAALQGFGGDRGLVVMIFSPRPSASLAATSRALRALRASPLE
jgi:hypothetical protein